MEIFFQLEMMETFNYKTTGSFKKQLKPFTKFYNVEYFKTVNYTFCNYPLYLYKFIENDNNIIYCYTTNENLTPFEVWYLMHHRWDEEETFNNITKNSNITHNYCSSAKELILTLQFIAYNCRSVFKIFHKNQIVIINRQPNLKATIITIVESFINIPIYILYKILMS